MSQATNMQKMGLDPNIISQQPDVVSGAPVFPGTRVPVRFLLDFLAGGKPLGVFLRNFPTVTEAQAVHVLEHVFERTIGPRDDENPVR